MPLNDPLQFRKQIYFLLIIVTVGMAAGRICSAERLYEPTLHKVDQDDPRHLGNWPSSRPPALPTFSSNDRSRWAMIRALVDEGTFIIGKRDRDQLDLGAGSLLAATNPLEATTLVIASRQMRIGTTHSTWQTQGWESGWDTVDKALNPATQEFYSTKPPLLSMLVAGLYWLLQMFTGWTLAENVWEVVKTILLVINVLPFAIYLWLLALLVERFGTNHWSKVYIFAAGCFATLVTPFLITFNNHTIATFSVMFALYPALLILTGARTSARRASEGDSIDPRLRAGLLSDGDSMDQLAPNAAPRSLFLCAGLFAGFAVTCELPALAFAAGLGLILLLRAPGRTLLYFAPAVAVPLIALVATNYIATGMIWPIYSFRYTEWYMYEGSHWAYPPGTHRGIDYAKYHETKGEYAFHVLIGHHGLFSLTPMWLLAFAGMILGWFASRRKTDTAKLEDRAAFHLPWYFFAAALLLSVIVLGFYLTNEERNYGGWTLGLRWLMWLTPIWLLCLLPVTDRLGNYRWGRGLAYVLLMFSVLSVNFSSWNPWRHPWIYRWMDANGWLPY